MEKVKTFLKDNIWLTIFSTFAIVLMLISFFLPPMGVIDSSALEGTAWAFGFSALYTLRYAIQKGMDAKIQHNNTSVTIGAREEIEQEMEEVVQ